MTVAPEQPIFVLGMPRSGTTIVFEALARHPRLGWISNYCRMFPRQLWVNVLRRALDNRVLGLHGRKKQYGEAPPWNYWLPQPDEAYEFWDCHSGTRFSRRALAGEACPDGRREALRRAVARVLTWQGRSRLAAKLTGPPRITFLSSVFPDARFVHVIRDGRAVTHSLLGVRFWKEKGGLSEPFWQGLLEDATIRRWKASGRSPGVLAALQWKAVVELARAEAAELPRGRYQELRYEEFIEDPHERIDRVMEVCGLDVAAAVHEGLRAGPELTNMNRKYEAGFDAETVRALTQAMQPLLGQLGYAPSQLQVRPCP